MSCLMWQLDSLAPCHDKLIRAHLPAEVGAGDVTQSFRLEKGGVAHVRQALIRAGMTRGSLARTLGPSQAGHDVSNGEAAQWVIFSCCPL